MLLLVTGATGRVGAQFPRRSSGRAKASHRLRRRPRDDLKLKMPMESARHYRPPEEEPRKARYPG